MSDNDAYEVYDPDGQRVVATYPDYESARRHVADGGHATEYYEVRERNHNDALQKLEQELAEDFASRDDPEGWTVSDSVIEEAKDLVSSVRNAVLDEIASRMKRASRISPTSRDEMDRIIKEVRNRA